MPTYPGGKNGAGTFHRIINLMPPHDRYFEMFLGSGAIMRRKKPARINFGCDLSAEAIVLCEDLRQRPCHVIVQGDAFEALAQPFKATDLIYLDPPYMPHTRRGEEHYEFEMESDSHRRLLRRIAEIRCMVMISGYWSQTYAKALAEWNSIQFQVTTRGALATEWLWYNFPPPTILHDFGLLGEGFRERERIKKKKARWVARLRAMPLLERQAIAGAVMETLNE